MRQDFCQLMSQHRRKTEEVVLWYSANNTQSRGTLLEFKAYPGKATVYKVKRAQKSILAGLCLEATRECSLVVFKGMIALHTV